MTFRIDDTLKTKLENKAKELNTTQTAIIKDGIYKMFEEENTVKQKTEVMVRNQEYFNRLLARLDTNDKETISLVMEILKGEQTIWQL